MLLTGFFVLLTLATPTLVLCYILHSAELSLKASFSRARCPPIRDFITQTPQVPNKVYNGTVS